MLICPLVHAERSSCSVFFKGTEMNPGVTFISMSDGGTWQNSKVYSGILVRLSVAERNQIPLAEIRLLRIEIPSADAATDKRECIIRFENFTFYLLLLMLVMLQW